MAIGLCNPRNVSRGECLFIADIDAGTAIEARAIYKVREPLLGSANTQPLAAERYPIAYDLPEGEEAPAAASLGVHPLTGTFYIVTREANEARVFEGAAPNLPGDTITFRAVGKVGLDQPTGADMSPDGNFFIVRNATDAVEYNVVNADMAATLAEPGERLPLEDDGGGQSIAYAPLEEPSGFSSNIIPTAFEVRHQKNRPFNLYTAGASAAQSFFYYGYLCDAPPRPEPYDMRPPSPMDMGNAADMGASDLGLFEDMDAPEDMGDAAEMGDAQGDGESGGCSSASASAPAALLWLLAPLVALRKRRRGHA
jgi:Synergist-CTERM protein sorting domain-containing protein